MMGHDFFASDINCWALGEQVPQVSKLRLRPFHADPSKKLVMPSGLATKIERAVVRAINAANLLAPDAALTAAEGIAITWPPQQPPRCTR